MPSWRLFARALRVGFTVIVVCALAACASSVRTSEVGRDDGSTVGSAVSEVDAVFVARSVVSEGRTVRYRVFVPKASAAVSHPVVLFLHGSGERGTDNASQTRSGLGPYLRNRPDFPAITVFPQAPPETNWTGAIARDAMAALDDAMRVYGGDPSRFYVTGMSRGGYGVWELALAFPGRFAALVPVCGGLENPDDYDDLYVAPLRFEVDPYAELARRIGDVPVWLFHGALDDLVAPENSRRIVAAMQAAGFSPRYTEFADANHNSWDPAYASDALWEWLFAQHRN